MVSNCNREMGQVLKVIDSKTIIITDAVMGSLIDLLDLHILYLCYCPSLIVTRKESDKQDSQFSILLLDEFESSCLNNVL